MVEFNPEEQNFQKMIESKRFGVCRAYIAQIEVPPEEKKLRLESRFGSLGSENGDSGFIYCKTFPSDRDVSATYIHWSEPFYDPLRQEDIRRHQLLHLSDLQANRIFQSSLSDNVRLIITSITNEAPTLSLYLQLMNVEKRFLFDIDSSLLKGFISDNDIYIKTLETTEQKFPENYEGQLRYKGLTADIRHSPNFKQNIVKTLDEKWLSMKIARKRKPTPIFFSAEKNSIRCWKAFYDKDLWQCLTWVFRKMETIKNKQEDLLSLSDKLEKYYEEYEKQKKIFQYF